MTKSFFYVLTSRNPPTQRKIFLRRMRYVFGAALRMRTMNAVTSVSFPSFLISSCIGLFVTLFCVRLLKPVAIRIGLVDVPGGRKKHANDIPLIGGLAIFIGFCFALLSFDVSLKDYRGLLAGSVILILLGIVDDFKELTPRIRLIGQCLATLLLIEWGHVSLMHLGNLFSFGNVELGVGIVSLSITIFIVLSFINAINMIDGHDGLAGIIVLGQVLVLAFYDWQYHCIQTVCFLMIFAIVLSVFLIFNLPLPWQKRASIFLGDAGSTFVGFFTAWFALALSQLFLTSAHPVIGYNLITVLWILAYPLFDLLTVILRRLTTKRSPFVASRDHLHYLLSDLSFSTGKVTFILFLLSLAFSMFGLFLAKLHIHEFWQLLIFIGLFFTYFWMSLCLSRKTRGG